MRSFFGVTSVKIALKTLQSCPRVLLASMFSRIYLFSGPHLSTRELAAMGNPGADPTVPFLKHWILTGS